MQNKSYNIPNSVATIEAYAFKNCSGLTNVEIPSSVTSIGSGAFSGCDNIEVLKTGQTGLNYGWSVRTNLREVILYNDVNNIKYGVFNGCSNLASINIPSGVTSIDYDAFKNCSSLASISIPNSVTSIGSSVFSGCSSLTSIKIPNSVTSIGSSVFKGCNNLTIYCEKDSRAESYAKSNNINYSIEGYKDFIDYTLTETDLPADIGDSIRFKYKIYEYDKNSLIGNIGGGYSSQLTLLLKDESLINDISYTCSKDDIVELSPSKNSSVYISLIGEGDYKRSVTVNVSLLKNGEGIVTASLPNGDRSSCLIKLKGFPIGYDTAKDSEVPHIKVETELDRLLNYQNGSFDRSVIPVKVTVSNFAVIKESGEGYTEEELNRCNLKEVKAEVELPNGLSFDSNSSIVKQKTFYMNDIDVGGMESLEFNLYPTELTSRTLKFWIKFSSNNYSESNTYVITVNTDEKVNYDVSTPVFEGFLDEDGKQTSLPPEERFKLNVEKYNAAIEDYENFTANRLNGMKTASEKNDDFIYAHIRETIKENMEFNYTSESGDLKESAAQEAAALKGLYKYISEQTDAAIGLGKINLDKTDSLGMISIETSVAKAVLNSIKSGKHIYTIDRYDVIIYDAGSNWGTVMGAIQLVDRTTGKEVRGIGAFSTSSDKCKKVMQAYAGEISQMGINAINSSISQTIDFLSDKSGVKKYVTGKFGDFLDEKLPKFRGMLNDKGLGEVATFISNTYKMQKALDGIDVNNLEGSKKLLEQLLNQEKNLEEAPTIKTMAAKKAYDGVKKARNAVISSGMAYITNSPEPDNFITKTKNAVKSWNFKCPVNIIVYDENGNQIGSIIGDEITCNSEVIEIIKKGDLKTVCLYDESDISFDIIPTDYGMLNVTVENYNDESVALGREVFYDIPLYKDNVLSANIKNGNAVIKSDESSYAPDDEFSSNESSGINITTEYKNGKVYGCGEYVKGDFVKLTAMPDEDYLFEGWYSGERFLNNSINYNFAAKEDLNLTAKFIALSDTIFINSPEITASEFEPENGKDVSVSIKVDEENAKIYYTTDGTEPTVNSNEYTEPFTISGMDETITIKAIAVVNGNASEITVKEIIFHKFDISNVKIGDVDCDNEITKNDAVLVLQKVLNEDNKLPIEEKTDEWVNYADADANKQITATDAALILKKATEKDFVLPVEAEK